MNYLLRLFDRLSNWYAHRKLLKACDESRKRVSAMDSRQRKELELSGLAIIYPEGYWQCSCGSPNPRMTVVVGAGKTCGLCGRAEPISALEAEDEQKPK